ncbi:putative reverse transcriptase domain-containing protein [Tanacetum coccineum]|uniref:Reverse transcriptase domain-containing protein n=1 Tax=Tanacetum coccineum TaxID=301880 RepID=A0ABQ5GF32_9ASTR
MLIGFPMSLTGAVSHWLKNKPSGSITTWKDLKTKFLSKYCPPARNAKKMKEINNFQQEPDENLYQAWERFKELLMKGAISSKTIANAKVAIQEMAEYSQKWHNGTSRTKSIETYDGLAAIQAQLNNLGREIKKVNEKVYAAQVGCEQCKGGAYRATALGFYQRNNANPSYQERRQSMEEILSKFMGESEKRHEENSNLIKEIRALMDAAIRNQGASIKTLEIQIGKMSKVLQERGFGSLPCSTKTNPRDHVKSISTIVKADTSSIRRIRSYQYAIFIIIDMPEDIKVPLILGRPFLSTAHAKIDVFKRKITLRVGEEKIIFKSFKPASSLIKRVYMLSLRERMELDLKAKLNGDDMLRRDQVDDLMPTIEEGKVIEKFRDRNDARMVSKIFEYPSDCDHDNKILLEDMDAYHDEGMRDVIFGEPFLREVRINAKRFKGMITIHIGNEEVTYEMVRSHPSFKHHTNEQCNKIPPLLKVSKEDMMKGIWHSYQKLKSFYKGVLNLGPEYVRDAKMEEWLTRGNISVHEME